MKEIDEQLKSILSHIEKLKPEIEKYLSNCTMEPDKKTSIRKINPALKKTLTATDELAEIVGQKSITRQQAVANFWIYVKKHNLQDPKDKRNINLDEPLKRAFGNKEQVDMFEALKLLSKNLK